ncbi:MAG: hypothetical protein HYW50_04760 [Candidatus Diapherotrites archaeon]|nr:hypothetical protein [Candidatus Diapherotrites archaeon]
MKKAKLVQKEQQMEEIKEVEEQLKQEPEEGEVDESKLPFPRATIVNMLRKQLSTGKQIKGQVKDEMNIWLAKMVERIAKKMDAHPYTYVDGSMFREAIEPYENIQDIEREKERIIKQLEVIKAACDVLISEVDRKFVK